YQPTWRLRQEPGRDPDFRTNPGIGGTRSDKPVDQHAIVIAGGGPTGMMLAAELALAKIDVVIVERRATQELDGSRSRGLHARTIEILDQRGVADRFLAEGQAVQV